MSFAIKTIANNNNLKKLGNCFLSSTDTQQESGIESTEQQNTYSFPAKQTQEPEKNKTESHRKDKKLNWIMKINF